MMEGAQWFKKNMVVFISKDILRDCFYPNFKNN